MPPRRERKKKGAGKRKVEGIKLHLGNRVRALREGRGWTQRDLATASGISSVFLGTIERGEKAATIESIEKLARGLDVAPAVLFEFDAPAKAHTEDGAAKLARKITLLARDASESKLARFERCARAFFEDDA